MPINIETSLVDLIQENHPSINHCFGLFPKRVAYDHITDHNNYYHYVNGLNTKLWSITELTEYIAQEILVGTNDQ